MALIQMNFNSRLLAMQTQVNIIIPESHKMLTQDFNHKFKTLYLLHGLSNDNTTYTRYTSIERYACARNLAVVMPAVDHSFYTDMKYGHPYFSYISEELPCFMRNLFPLSEKREDNFVAGHSMGGYGSFKLALTRPGAFAAAASMSGVMDINYLLKDKLIKEEVLEGFNPQSIYGESGSLSNTKHDLFHLLERNVQDKVPLPRLLQICGTEDFLYRDNLAFRDLCRCLGVDLMYDEGKGEHTWDFWAERIKQVIDWLPLEEES